MDAKIDSVKQVMMRALRSEGIAENEAHQIVFHLTDWLEDLKPFIALLEAPQNYNDAEVNRILIRFLVHAPDHLKTAAEIILDAETEDQASHQP